MLAAVMAVAGAVRDEELLAVDLCELVVPLGSPAQLYRDYIIGLGTRSGRKLWFCFDGTVGGGD